MNILFADNDFFLISQPLAYIFAELRFAILMNRKLPAQYLATVPPCQLAIPGMPGAEQGANTY